MCCRKLLFDAQEIDCWSGGCCTESLAGNFATKCVMLEIKEPGGTLNIGDIIKADTFYMLVDGRIVPETDIKEAQDGNA